MVSSLDLKSRELITIVIFLEKFLLIRRPEDDFNLESLKLNFMQNLG